MTFLESCTPAKSFVKLDYLLSGIVGRVNGRGRPGRKRLLRFSSLFRIGRRVCGCSRLDLETLTSNHPHHHPHDHQRQCAYEFEFVHGFPPFLARNPPRGKWRRVYNCQRTFLNRPQKENELFRNASLASLAPVLSEPCLSDDVVKFPRLRVPEFCVSLSDPRPKTQNHQRNSRPPR